MRFILQMGVPSTDVPNVTIWSDFQCPACGAFESRYGDSLATWAREGKITPSYRPATFMDRNYPASNQSSLRANAASGAAIAANKGPEYIKAVYAAAPQKEGEWFTNEQLIALGRQVGITSDDLAVAINSGKYLPWATNLGSAFESPGVTATPTVWVNDKEVKTTGTETPEQLLITIQAAK